MGFSIMAITIREDMLHLLSFKEGSRESSDSCPIGTEGRYETGTRNR